MKIFDTIDIHWYISQSRSSEWLFPFITYGYNLSNKHTIKSILPKVKLPDNFPIQRVF